MEISSALGIVITILLTLMVLLMTFFIYQQSKLNEKVDKTNELLKNVSDRLLIVETEHKYNHVFHKV
jgi:hypothetical protein